MDRMGSLDSENRLFGVEDDGPEDDGTFATQGERDGDDYEAREAYQEYLDQQEKATFATSERHDRSKDYGEE